MEKKSIVEEALLSMKNLQEAVSENAKGILASTMKEEIKDLVKESLEEEISVNEADEDETEDQDEDNIDINVDDEEGDEDSDDYSDEIDFEDQSFPEDGEDSFEDDDDAIVTDLTNEPMDVVMKVFKSMKDTDGVIVKKDDNKVHLKDENTDAEYMIDLGESIDEYLNESDLDADEVLAKIFDNKNNDDMKNETYEDLDETWNESDETMTNEVETEEGETEEVMYEISLDDESDDLFGDNEYSGMNDEDDFMNIQDGNYEENYEEVDETSHDFKESMTTEPTEDYDFKETYKAETKEGSMMSKPKVGKHTLGDAKKGFKYGKTTGGFDESKSHGVPKIKGKPKFEYKEGKHKMEKAETKEAARTLGSGSKFREGGLPKPRSHSGFNANIKENVADRYEEQLKVLREKNEEYRKALNIFREKLNEVAVFNSNLAYATRLFTEHSTTKQEKINILRRFDGVETLKESKNLYRTLKDELGEKPSKVVTESISNKIEKEVSSGSATSLIESKTYENPQFMRMKDLMSKLIK